jgi:circadian clock protein KaiB
VRLNSIAAQSDEWIQALSTAVGEKYFLRLYVTGTTPKSIRAITNIKEMCETHLKGRYSLEVIDIYQQPARAKDEQIIAVPTLIKALPLPLRKFIGDMTRADRILIALDVRPKAKPPEANGKSRRTKSGK